MKRGKLKNITRMDYERSHGWWVRFEYRAKPISKMFSDSSYGGKRASRAAAIKYRDEVLQTLPNRSHQHQAPGKGRIWRETRSYVLASSGERRTYEAWTGWCRVAPNRSASSNASIDKWGVRRARRMVESWLEGKLEEQKRNYYRILGLVLH
jgi:hypothetical protein